MAYFEKIGLLVLNEDATKFLVCEKSPDYDTTEYIMPGGQRHDMSDVACLRKKIDDELGCDIRTESLELIGEYIGPAAGHPGKDVWIRLYCAKLLGIPTPSSEIDVLHWIGKDDRDNPRVSYIVREKIIPDLVKRKILY